MNSRRSGASRNGGGSPAPAQRAAARRRPPDGLGESNRRATPRTRVQPRCDIHSWAGNAVGVLLDETMNRRVASASTRFSTFHGSREHQALTPVGTLRSRAFRTVRLPKVGVAARNLNKCVSSVTVLRIPLAFDTNRRRAWGGVWIACVQAVSQF